MDAGGSRVSATSSRPDVNAMHQLGTLPANPFATAMPVLTAQDEINSRPGIPWHGVSEIFAPLPPVPWVVRDLCLAPGRPALFAGYGFSGKSISAQALALAVAAGKPVWGQFHVAQVGRVLHFDHEQGRQGTFRRYQRLAFGMGIGADDLDDRLQVTCFSELRLSASNARDQLLYECEGANLVIFDSLRAMTPDVNENDSIIRAHIDNLTYVSEQNNCCFLLVHHAGKGRGDGDQREAPRGSSAIFDACGLVLNLRQHESDEEGVTLTRVSMSKSPAEAEGAARSDWYLRIEDVADSTSGNQHAGLRCAYRTNEQIQHVDGPAQRQRSLAEQAIMFIRRNSGASKSEIRASIKCRATDVDAVLDNLERHDKIEVRKEGRKLSYYIL